jgi:hypothetical protein
MTVSSPESKVIIEFGRIPPSNWRQGSSPLASAILVISLLLMFVAAVFALLQRRLAMVQQ